MQNSFVLFSVKSDNEKATGPRCSIKNLPADAEPSVSLKWEAVLL